MTSTARRSVPGRCFWKRALGGAAFTLLCAVPLHAHLVDAYLQTSQITINARNVLIAVNLTPGTEIAPALLKTLDANSDGIVTQAEAADYARNVVSNLSVSVDGKPLHLQFVSGTSPTAEELKTGSAEIHVESIAELPDLGSGDHHIVFENGFRVPGALYLANAMLPREPRVTILAQERNQAQDRLEIKYKLAYPTLLILTWSSLAVILAGWVAANLLRGRTARVTRGIVILLLAFVLPVAEAHDLPFSYLNLHRNNTSIEGTCVIHIFDAGHDLHLAPEQLLQSATANRQFPLLTSMLGSRLQVSADGKALAPVWTGIAIDGQRIVLSMRYALPSSTPHDVTVQANLFPYDPNHQTYLNLYAGKALAQAVLTAASPTFTYELGTAPSALDVVRHFLPEGFRHILIGPDHLLFLCALLLRGGRIRRLALIVSMFTIAHSLTLSFAALGIVTPPAYLVEPAIALTIVVVALDTLVRPYAADHRPAFAFVFGLVHGFGFANVLREMALPAKALGWSLFSFNLGVEFGQLLVVCILFAAFSAIRRIGPAAEMRLRVAGSCGVAVAGAVWFAQRIMSPPR